MSTIRTVLGDIDAADLGVCYAHEHLFIGPSWATATNPDFLLDELDRQAEELRAFHAAGGRAMVDSMPCDCGRNARALAEMSRRSGVHIICPTGLHLARYYDPGHWSHSLSVEHLSELFVADIQHGVDRYDYGCPLVERTLHRAGVIKVAAGAEWTEREERVFTAAAEAHRRTGCPILTHTEEGALGLEQASFFRREGVSLRHVCLSHMDRRPDAGYHRALLETGVRLEYDSGFRWKGRADNPTADLVAGLIGDFPDQIMLGMDAARRSYWKCYGGGPGLTFLLEGFSAILRERGVPAAALQKIFVTTPAQTFSFHPVIP